MLAAPVCARAQPPSSPVILISIDTLLADHIGAYGYTNVRTPNIDSLADHGTLFTQAVCQAPLTLPSHTSMLTSTFPFENQIEENAERVPPCAATLAAVLHSHGYKTAAFIGSVFLERQMGLDPGFDFYDSPFNFDAFSPMSGSMFLGAVSNSPFAGKERRDGALVLRATRQWLSANNTQPVFAFVHLFDMHKPYPVGYDEQLKYVDRLMGTFQQSVAQLGLWDKALVILVSDHGEGLGEHGEASHGYFVYESTLHVPLIFHWPAGTSNHPARVDDPAGLIDVARCPSNHAGADRHYPLGPVAAQVSFVAAVENSAPSPGSTTGTGGPGAAGGQHSRQRSRPLVPRAGQGAVNQSARRVTRAHTGVAGVGGRPPPYADHRDGTGGRLLPRTEQAAHQHQLSQVVGVVVGNEQSFTQNRLTIAVRYRFAEAGRSARHQPAHRFEIGAKGLYGPGPRRAVGRSLCLWPIAGRPFGRAVRRIAAEFEDVPLSDAHVIDDFPGRVCRAPGSLASQGSGQTFGRRVEARVGSAAVEQIEEMLAESFVVIVGHGSLATTIVQRRVREDICCYALDSEAFPDVARSIRLAGPTTLPQRAVRRIAKPMPGLSSGVFGIAGYAFEEADGRCRD